MAGDFARCSYFIRRLVRIWDIFLWYGAQVGNGIGDAVRSAKSNHDSRTAPTFVATISMRCSAMIDSRLPRTVPMIESNIATTITQQWSRVEGIDELKGREIVAARRAHKRVMHPRRADAVCDIDDAGEFFELSKERVRNGRVGMGAAQRKRADEAGYEEVVKSH